MSRACSVYGGRSGEVYTGLWWGDLRDERIILRWIFRKWDGVWTGSSWLRIVTGGTHLCMW